MKTTLNTITMLWIIGVLQPVSAEGIAAYLRSTFEDESLHVDVDILKKFCLKHAANMNLIRVSRKPDLFSLTVKGNGNFTKKQRHERDKERLYLLSLSRRARIHMSREVLAKGLDGVAPSADTRTSIKGREANKLGPVVPSGQVYWPRFSKKLLNQTCRLQPSCDTLPLPLLSFADAKQLAIALNQESVDFDVSSLGLMMGISPRLIVQMCWKPARHYRTFSLRKKSGGERTIDSPRVFLKTVQQFLNDYFLNGLPVHECAEAFRTERSILTNASRHVGKAFVANIDIKNFFPSVSAQRVLDLLKENSYTDRAARMIVHLCTKDGALPQGAPTSPALSNAYLYSFDGNMNLECDFEGLKYSRYADDITISGEDKGKILKMIRRARSLLRSYGLELNENKTRIASAHGQQRVTGLVVNQAVRPPRKLRREVRAAFHDLSNGAKISNEEIKRLAGYVSYFSSFEELRETREIATYREILSGYKKSK